MNKIKKPLKYILAFTIPFLVSAVCFGLVWFQFLQDVPQKSESYYLNDNYDSLTSPLTDGVVFTQDFTVGTSMYGIGLNFNVVDNTLDGQINVKLTDKTNGNLLMDYTNNIGSIFPAGYTCFTLDTPVTESGSRDYQLSVMIDYLTPEVSSGQMLSLRKSSKIMDGFGLFTESTIPADGSLAVMVVKDMIGTAPIKYYRFAGLLGSVFAGIIMLILVAFPKKKAVTVFLTVFFTGVMYHIALPVFSAPDEETHFNTAYALSSKTFDYDFEYHSDYFPKRNCDENRVFTDYNTSVFSYRYIYQNINRSTTASDIELIAPYSPHLYMFDLPYYVPSLVITACRILELNEVITAFAARGANLILYCIAVTLAWYFIPFFKNGLLAIALLPMTIHTGTSLSYDSMTLIISFLIISLALNCAYTDSKTDIKKLAALSTLCIIIAPIKIIYILLILLLFIIPNEKFKNSNWRWKYKIGTVVTSSLFLMFFHGFRFIEFLSILFPVASAAELQTIVETPVPLDASVTFSLSYLLSHPGVALKLISNSFFTKFTFYFGTIFGAALGYLNLAQVDINPVIIFAFVIVMFTAFIPHKDDKPLTVPFKLINLFIFIAVTGATVLRCIMWTPIDYDFIWGFQGRYLLPVLPLLMMSLQSKTIAVNKDISNIIIYSLFSLNLVTVLNTFIVVFSR